MLKKSICLMFAFGAFNNASFAASDLDNCKSFLENDLYEQAVEPCQAAAEQGDAEAQTNLGVMYDNGSGVAQDYEKAAYWYQKAAQQGVAEAQYSLGTMYDNGIGVTEDYKLAYMWWWQAAQQGNDVAAEAVNLITEELSSSELKEAQELAQKCQNSNFKDCGY